MVLLFGCASLSVPWETAAPIDRFQAYNGPDGIPVLPGSVDADIPDVDILSVNSDMASALDSALAHAKKTKDRMDALVGFLVRRVRYDALADSYGAKTALETFESGSGNCLSFTNLFVAMARYAGLETSYQEILTPPHWERDGEVLLSTRHIGASIDIMEGTGRVILLEVAGAARALSLDGSRRYFFIPTVLSPSVPAVNLNSAKIISDKHAFAQYYNNLGSRYMAEGNGSDAFRYFVKAVKTDPSLSFAWSNLGVAYSRNGQFDAAREVFLHGLSITRGKRDVTALTILSNLVEHYRRDGDEEKEAFYRSEVASFRRKNPYYQYAIAKKAFKDSLYEQSVKYFKKAIRLKDDEHLFYFGLALAYDKLGNIKKAEKYIKKAKFHAFSEEKKMYYERVWKYIAK